MARLGHASPRAAMVYQHATEDRDRLIAERLTVMTAEAGIKTAGQDTSWDEAIPEGTAERSGTVRARQPGTTES